MSELLKAASIATEVLTLAFCASLGWHAAAMLLGLTKRVTTINISNPRQEETP